MEILSKKIKRGSFERDEKLISLLLTVLMFNNSTIYFINNIINLFVSPGFIWDTVSLMVLMGILLVYCLPSLLRRLSVDSLILILMLLALYFISFMINNQNISGLEDIFVRLFLQSIPFYLLTRSIKDYSYFKEYFKIGSYINVITSTVLYVLYLNNINIQLEYMVFSYNLLPGTIYFFYSFLKNKKLLDFSLAITGFLIIFLAGARGPLICIIAFLLLFSSLNKIKNLFHMSIFLVLISLVYLVFDKFYTSIISFIGSTLRLYGVQSRTFDLMANNNLIDLSNRDDIYKVIYSAIGNNPFFGVGLGGDGFILQRHFNSSGLAYSHNIFLEFIVQYGVILGTLFLVIIFLLIYHSLKRKSIEVNRDIVCIFISLSIVKLFFTGSYLYEPYFFALLGLTVNTIARKHDKEIF